jgi:hypothetical protein
MTVSNARFTGSQPAFQARPHFAGKEVTEQYLAQIRKFPEDTFKRLADVAYVSKHQGPAHIGLAKKYAVADGNMESLNHVVTEDVTTRDRNKRRDPETSAKAAEHLKDFRLAIATAMNEKGYPEDGQELDDAERQRLLQPSFMRNLQLKARAGLAWAGSFFS